MTVETINTGVEDLDPNLPAGTDPKSEGDNHIRNLKTAIGLSFPNSDGAWNTTSEIRAQGFDSKTTRIRNVGVPVDATDAARKGETDALATRVGALEGQVAITSYGVVGAGGTPGAGTGDFFVNKAGTGEYILTYDDPATNIDSNITVATPFTASTQDCTIQIEPLSATQQVFRTSRNGAPADVGFYFNRIKA